MNKKVIMSLFRFLCSVKTRLDELEVRINNRFPLFAAFHRRLYLWVYIVAALPLLFFQSYLVGFPEGSHGWVSAHNLAVISNTTSDTAFVGYTLSFDTGNKIDYDYFRRSPFVCGLLQRFLTMTFTDDLRTQVFLNRQLWNLVLIASMWTGFLILRQLIKNDNYAMAATLLSFSGYYFMFYKDLVCPDNFSVLGILLLLYGILDYMTKSRRWVLYTLAIIAVSIGWGYSAIPTLIVWILVDVCSMLWRTGFHSISWLKKFFRLESVRVFGLTILLSAAYLGQNIAVEMHMNNVSIEKTDIVESAMTRLYFNKNSFKRRKELEWSRFAKGQVQRAETMLYPYKLIEEQDLGGAKYAVYGLMLLALIGILIKWNKRQRIVGISLLLSGFLWLFPMRGLSAFHDYTSVCYMGLPLVAFGALFFFLPRRLSLIVLLASFLAFGSANISINEKKNAMAREVNGVIDDFQSIAEQSKSGGTIYFAEGYKSLIRGVPYAAGFLLKDHRFVKDKKRAKYIVSKKRKYNEQLLTKRNRHMFLFANK